jgi:hypothetical protein
VLTLFLLPELNRRLMPAILAMKPGTRVVSNSFSMGDWRPDKTAEVTQDCKTYCRALLWIVPAKVDGAWQVRFPGGPAGPDWLLTLNQTHQYVTGAMSAGPDIVVPVKGRLDGSAITLVDAALGGYFELVGEVKGDRMEGSPGRVARQPAGPWSATREKSL